MGDEIRSYVLNGRRVHNPDVMDLIDAYANLSALLDPIRAAAWDEGYDAGRSETQRGSIVRTNPYRKEPK